MELESCTLPYSDAIPTFLFCIDPSLSASIIISPPPLSILMYPILSLSISLSASAHLQIPRDMLSPISLSLCSHARPQGPALYPTIVSLSLAFHLSLGLNSLANPQGHSLYPSTISLSINLGLNSIANPKDLLSTPLFSLFRSNPTTASNSLETPQDPDLYPLHSLSLSLSVLLIPLRPQTHLQTAGALLERVHSR